CVYETATLPLKIYERQADGSRKLASDNPAYQVLCRRPNPEMTPSRFMLMVVASICLRGNAFVEKLFIGRKLVSLVPLLPQNMVVKRLDSGQLQYSYTENGKQRIIPVNRIMHIRGFGLDGVCGMMPAMTGIDVFGAAMSVDEAAAKIFENGLQSTGFLSSKNALTKEQRDRLRQNLQSFIGSKNAGKLMVLENELTYQNVTMNPEAAQLLESRS
ncbi:phage portal protein, partial [Salmonella enterica]|uniref:phage portal protein n=1 Tax=Salmonella enterica TaxID=28901 RepID=UPI001124EB93